MNLVTGQDDIIIPWLAQTYGHAVVQSPRVVLGIADRGVLRGAFVLIWHQYKTAELGVFGTVSPSVAKDLFHLAFGPLGVHRLEVRTDKKNRTIKRAAPKFGFKFEGVARDYYGPGDAALVFAMTPDQCRWIAHG